jgi:hypothetical protein
MNIKPLILASAISLLAGSVWAQSTNTPLNLKLPGNLPASSSTAAPASSSTAANTPAPTSVHPGTVARNGRNANNGSATNTPPPISTTPGVYYGDTSGRLGDNGTADTQTCDDSKYNDPQVHGSISTGVVSGSHIGTSSYSGGEVNVTKAFGDCDHPTGGISISIGGTTNNFNDRGYRRGY